MHIGELYIFHDIAHRSIGRGRDSALPFSLHLQYRINEQRGRGDDTCAISYLNRNVGVLRGSPRLSGLLPGANTSSAASFCTCRGPWNAISNGEVRVGRKSEQDPLEQDPYYSADLWATDGYRYPSRWGSPLSSRAHGPHCRPLG